ncbi:probable 28S ribosomal protein S26, mitochondrial [Leptopilina heterotoma]|uniref:probable 28S ribosomal protein S26, mitochondrial n=1 Tax=Leptopilina heterotoma TaxID=63436 RepID=UPI001CA92968|nr:probable 28S ribosomal protein S26, mitochondrial [Leptopilina heterotoma]
MAQPWMKRFYKLTVHSTWKRKPFWLPMAKSKMFKIPPRPVIPQEESEEIHLLFNHYRTAVNSLRRHFIKVTEESNVQLDPELIEKAKEDDFLACSAINDEWNKQISIERDVRLEEERELKKEFISNAIEKHKKRKEEKLEIAKEELRKAQELIPTLITSSNIDEAIDTLLKNVVNHNYAIDIDGEKFTGTDYYSIEKKQKSEDELLFKKQQQSN